MKKRIAIIGLTGLSAILLSTNFLWADAGFTAPGQQTSVNTAKRNNTISDDNSLYTNYLEIKNTSKLELEGNPQKAAIHPRGDFLLVPAKDLDFLYYLPITGDNKVIKADFTLPTGKGPTDVVISSNGWRAYVINETDKTVTVYKLDEEESETITTINLDGAPVSLALSPDNKYLYVLCKNDDEVEVIKLDDKDSKVVNTLNVGNDPASIKITTDGTRAYVVNKGDNTVTEIDLTYPSGRIFKKQINVSEYPTDIALGPENDIALVASGLEDKIDLFNPTENPSVIFGSINNLNRPFGLASDPINKFCVAINYYSGGLDFFNLKYANQKNISYLQHDTILIDDKPEYISINPQKNLLTITHPRHNIINVIKYHIKKEPIVTEQTPTINSLSDIDTIINQGMNEAYSTTNNQNNSETGNNESRTTLESGSTEDIIEDVLSEQGNILRGRTGIR